MGVKKSLFFLCSFMCVIYLATTSFFDKSYPLLLLYFCYLYFPFPCGLTKHTTFMHTSSMWKSQLVLYCIVLYCFEGVVIAAQCTATFLRSIVLPRI